MSWGVARKRPILVKYREVIPKEQKDVDVDCEVVYTREGVLLAYPDEDFIIRGFKGELYPIKKEIFYETYDVVQRPNGSET